ncbi:hypothetical protein OHB01_07720 [Microbispora hainanensis]|uniref:hypothetical protein n=1 Tax=Microbispora hainanensis TaxID=568844 RepID=UPI002E2A43B7|nr:hypothetical protein [Microbispora hainanensis]
MPSPLHDTLNLLFRHRPQFAVEMLRDHLGVDVPDGLPVQVASNDLNDRPSIDLRPDVVITVGPRHSPLHAIVVEIQQKEEPDKLHALPRYAAALWLQLACPITVLMICPKARTAKWASAPIRTSLPGYTLACQVIGPDQIPAVTDPAEAAAHPELAALSVMAHGEHPPVIEAFVAALRHLPDEHAPQYYEYAYRLATKAARYVMERVMETTTWPVYSPFARQHYGKGLEVGRAEGREEGREEGRRRGRAEGEARAVLTVLEARGIAVSDSDRAFISACTDVGLLDEWVRRAATATSAADLFAEES